MKKRRAKVAHLPKQTREHINQMLEGGAEYKDIIKFLTSKGHPGFNAENIRAWKDGGYQDWLDQQNHITEMDGLRELSLEIAEKFHGTKIQQATLYVSAALLYKMLIKFNPAKLRERLDAEPERMLTVINCFLRLNRRTTEMELLEDYLKQEKDRRKQNRKGKSRNGKAKGLSDAARKQIERSLNLT